jgi:hypothetical protein
MKGNQLLILIILALTLNVSNAQNLDCNGVANGTSMIDDCSVCHQAYIYNFISHTVYFIADTTGLSLTSSEMLVLPNSSGNPYWNSSCLDCNGIVNGSSLMDTCSICQQAYIYNFITHQSTYVDNANLLIPGTDYDPSQEMVVLPGSAGDPYWNACLGCTDPIAANYDSNATINNGLCVAVAKTINLFFSEYSEGTGHNKYFEVFNPSNLIVDLSSYAYPSVSNSPSTPGTYEYWNIFASAAVIPPYGTYVVVIHLLIRLY